MGDGDVGDSEVGNSEEEEILNDEVFRFSQRMELYRFIFNMNRIKINCNNTYANYNNVTTKLY